MAGREKLDAEKWDNQLPRRLFATHRYPVAKLSIFSKPDILSFIHDKLKGTQEFDTIRRSCFGRLFDIPVMRCPISGRLIHALICRQLLTKNKYEFWTVFGGQPLRFSVAEFGLITGLPCGEFPETQELETGQSRSPGKDTFWKQLIGDDLNVTLPDLANMLTQSPDMPGWRRLGLALILIVDGILMSNIANERRKPTMKYVEMLKDVDLFLSFPWGRESFLCTIRSIRPGTRIPRSRGDDPLEKLRLKLQKDGMAIKGFPLVLQLWAYRAIPGLLAKIPVSADEPSFMEWPLVGLPRTRALRLEDVEPVKRIFERHPDIASGVRTKSHYLKTSYINVLLGLIETLCQSPEELSDDDLKEASAAVSYAVNTGFKLDWLVEKLDQVLEKKNKVQSGESRLPEMEEELLKLDKKRSDLKASWEKEKAKIAAAKIHFSFDDIV